jgi:hypothetical protein
MGMTWARAASYAMLAVGLYQCGFSGGADVCYTIGHGVYAIVGAIGVAGSIVIEELQEIRRHLWTVLPPPPPPPPPTPPAAPPTAKS